ncbi:hypothetical protein HDU93_003388, partial [Gonapodya sp. JEL0774]
MNLSTLKRDYVDLRQAKTDGENSIAELSSQRTSTEAQIRDLKTELTVAKNREDATVFQLTARIEDLELKLQETRAETSSIAILLRDARDEKQRLGMQIQDLESMASVREQQLVDFGIRHQDQRKKLADEFSNRERQLLCDNEALEARILVMERQRSDLESKISKSIRENALLRESFDRAKLEAADAINLNAKDVDQRITSASKAMAEKDKELVNLRDRIASLTEDLELSESTITHLRANVDKLSRDKKNAIADLTRRAEEAAVDVGEKWKREVEAVTRTAERKLQSAKSELATLTQALQTSKADLAETRKAFENQKSMLEVAVTDLEQSKRESSAHSKDVLAALKLQEDRVVVLEGTLSETRLECEALAKAKLEMDSKLFDANHAVAFYVQRIEDLEMSLLEEQSHGADLSSQYTELAEKLSASDSREQELKLQIAVVEEALHSNESLLAQKSGLIQSLENQLLVAEGSVVELRQNLEGLQNSQSVLITQLEDAKLESQSFDETVQTLVERLRNQESEHTRAVTEIEAKLLDSEKRILELTTLETAQAKKIAALEAAYRHSEAQSISAGEQLITLYNQLSERSQELRDVELANHSLNTSVADKTLELQRLAEKVSTLETAVDRLTTTLEKREVDLKFAIEDHQRAMELAQREYNTEWSVAEEEADELKREFASKLEEIENFERINAELTALLDSAKKAVTVKEE